MNNSWKIQQNFNFQFSFKQSSCSQFELYAASWKVLFTVCCHLVSPRRVAVSQPFSWITAGPPLSPRWVIHCTGLLWFQILSNVFLTFTCIQTSFATSTKWTCRPRQATHYAGYEFYSRSTHNSHILYCASSNAQCFINFIQHLDRCKIWSLGETCKLSIGRHLINAWSIMHIYLYPK